MSKKKRPQLGKLPPKHTFFLNPYVDARFTRCPSCDKPNKARKFPFLINVSPMQPLVLNMTGRYCPKCDLLILHQDRVEALIAFTLQKSAPSLIGNEYLVVGTVERKAWRESQKQKGNLKMIVDNLHGFKEVVVFEPEHYGWVPDE
ncbi:MAG: hypothetical protein CL608_15355 [Anaerolineaceae bacterium]|nr:hypothetical protein [Anaerolineaceae bacterium]